MNEERTRRCFLAVKVSEGVHPSCPRDRPGGPAGVSSEGDGRGVAARGSRLPHNPPLPRGHDPGAAGPVPAHRLSERKRPRGPGLRAFELKWGAVDVFCNYRGSPRVLCAPVVGDKFTLYYSEGLPVEGPVQSACPCPRRASPSIHTSRWAGSTGILPQRKADISKMLSAVLMDV